VRLSTGEVAVVVQIHAPDPFRPRVRVVFDKDGRRLELPIDRNLWEPVDESGALANVTSPLDPADYQIDPLTVV
jgi:hypothetical protein